MTSEPYIRAPAVAGLFYPENATALRRQVESFLGPSCTEPHVFPVRVVLSPHAGFPYSGAVAGGAFSRLRGFPIRTAVIISPSHVEAFHHVAVFAGAAYRTPLGLVHVDTVLAAALCGDDLMRVSDCGHVAPQQTRGEHGIEMLLPFLQCTHPEARMVAVVMGSQSIDACKSLAQALRANLGAGDVVFVSSDLSHFYEQSRAKELDDAFCAAFARLDGVALFDALAAGQCAACGGGPAVAALLAAGGPEGLACEWAGRGTSADVSGDTSSVVGYASAVVRANDGGDAS